MEGSGSRSRSGSVYIMTDSDPGGPKTYMNKIRPLQWHHSQADLIWPDGIFKDDERLTKI
jgi:hypothetical protein